MQMVSESPLTLWAAAGVQGRVRPEGAGEGRILGVADEVGAKGQKRKHTSGNRHKHAARHSCEPGQGGCHAFTRDVSVAL